MVFKVGKHFDPIKEKEGLDNGPNGMAWDLFVFRKWLGAPAFEHALWMVGRNLTSIACGYIAGADPLLVDELLDVYEACARRSLAREEWKSRVVQLPPGNQERRIFGITEKEEDSSPQAWFNANATLILIKWLRTATLDRAFISEVLSKDVEGRPAIEGASDSLDLLPLYAWQEIIALPNIPHWSGGHKRRQDAADRIALAFAEDPSQLHDPKSPARKRARSYMRGSMSQRWLAPGLSTYAMQWLRAIEWREGESGLSPREVMLRAYAYMPEVEPPPHIANEVNQLRKIPI